MSRAKPPKKTRLKILFTSTVACVKGHKKKINVDTGQR